MPVRVEARRAMSWTEIRKGQTLLRQGKLAEAEAHLRKGTAVAGRDPRPWTQLGMCLLEQHRPADALDALQEALGLAHDNSAALIYATLAASDAGLELECLRLEERTTAVCPGNQILPTMRALRLLRAHRPKEALDALEVPPSKQSPPWNRPELTASLPFVSRLLVEVERYLLPLEVPQLEWSEALNEPPEFPAPAPQSFLGVLELEKGLRGWWAHRLGQNARERALNCKNRERRKELFQQAAGHIRRARELDPHLFRCHYDLGETLLYANFQVEHDRAQLEEALDCFLRSWKVEGDNPYLNYFLGRCCQTLGQVQAGLGYYKKAIKVFTKLYEAHYGMAQCYLLLEDELESRRWFSKVTMSDLQMARDRLDELSRQVQEGAIENSPPRLPRLPVVQTVVTPEAGPHGSLLSVAEVSQEERETSGEAGDVGEAQ